MGQRGGLGIRGMQRFEEGGWIHEIFLKCQQVKTSGQKSKLIVPSVQNDHY
jgi:hypothetical protein